uniref:two-partner secretion domain-containing protein n=1 Tax=Marinimicrobium locisalis TaxID=546022 RepID=UPI003221FB0B
MKPLETTGNVSCRKPSFRRRFLSVAIVAAGQALFASSAQAGPEGGQVVGGRGDIAQDERTTTVTQATDRLAVDWDSFDVDSDEIVNYIQPGSDSIALNRILSHRGSEIHGQINANGRVVLVNPHGMVFGKDAQINVGGMIASGLSVDTSDFMNGDFTFAAMEGTEGTVINRGIIQASTGGSVGLLGRRVNNEGVISAELGAVNLAAGKEAVVTFDDAGLMGVRVTREILQDELGVDPALVNNGEISAAGGRVLLTASTSQEIFSQAVNTGGVGHADSVVVHDDGSFTLGGGADVVNTGTLNVSSTSSAAGRVAVLGENITHSGVVQADSQFSGVGGQVELHAQDTTLVTQYGRISAQSQTGQGGNIAVLGQRVGLTDHASLNASGASGGGQILVGGDYKGQNTAIRNSQRTYLGPKAVLQANALADGDGGRVIVWADELTRYAGHLEAKGLGHEGQGGFAEVSGKEVLEFTGTASLSGFGGAGTLLLDPRDITVALGGENIPVSGSVGFDDFFGDPPSEDVTFSSNSLANLLDGGTNVILEASRDIKVEDGITTNSNNVNSLTFKAGDDVQVNADISLGSGNIDFAAGTAVCGSAGCLTGGDSDLVGRSIALTGNLDSQGEIILRAADDIQVGAAIGETLSPSAVTLLAGNKITVSALQFGSTVQLAPLPEADQGEPKLILKAGDASLVGDLASASMGPDFSKDLIIEGALHTGGASMLLNAHGAVQLDANITTQGGHFNVGDADTQSGGYRPNSFSHTSGTINTGYGSQMMTVDGSEENLTVVGDVRIHTAVNDDSPEAGDVTLGLVDLGYVFSDVDDDGGLGRTGSIIVDAAGDFTLTSDFDFNDTGPRTGDGGSRNLASADEVAFDVTAGGSITLDAAIYDRYGDERDALEVSLNAGGTVTLNDILYTAGGNIDITGQSIAFGSGAVVDTGRAHDGTQTDTGGTQLGGWSNGSNFTLDTVTGGSLGNIITRDTCTDGTCAGDLAINRSGSANSYTLGQNADTNVSIAGTTTVAVGAGTVTLDNEGNHFEGSWNLTEAGTVGIRDDGDIQIDVGSVAGP